MDKRTITALVAAIIVALLGLVLIQLEWVRDTVALKDRQFSENVDNALVAVSDRLEHAEAVQSVKGALPNGHVDPVAMIDSRLEAGSSAPIDSLDKGSVLGNETLDQLLRGVLTAGMLRDIHARVDPRLLDSLIAEELHRRGITTTQEHGIFTQDGETVLLDLKDPGDSDLVRDSPHRTRLFRNDWPEARSGGTTYWLHLHVPAQEYVLLRNMWPMLTASGLFLLLIAAVFGITVRTIQRQKRLGDIKNDLVNNLTHELKTPISTISLACEALNDPGIPKDPEQVRLFTGMIRDENKRLGMLVESVLQSAVVDSGRMQLRISDVDMHALLADVVRNSSLQAENRGGRLVVDPKAELAHVRGDRTHLTNIFYNLIDNAVKYCNTAPQVHIVTKSDAQTLTITVRDNGIGIPRNEQGKIFDRLYRVPTGNVHNVKGFGLGLSYVRSVVERHGGTIRVESDPQAFHGSTGSLFTINLPFEHGEQDPPAVVRG
jgi:two-component system phosphate regulon sensor histidine kinase PhoR